jgi:WD40 repeat protein
MRNKSLLSIAAQFAIALLITSLSVTLVLAQTITTNKKQGRNRYSSRNAKRTPHGSKANTNTTASNPDGATDKRATAQQQTTNNTVRTIGQIPPKLTLQATNEHPSLAVVFSPDGDMLASGRAKDVVLWDVNKKDINVLKEFQTSLGGVVNAVAFSSDSKSLASASDNGAVKLWDAKNGTQMGELRAGQSVGLQSLSLAFSPDKNTLAGGNSDGTITIWDIEHKSSIALQTGINKPVLSVAFSPDRKLLVAGLDDGSVVIWDAEKALQKDTASQTPQKVAGHSAGVFVVVFAKDGKLLATASGDQTVKVWILSKDGMAEQATLTHPTPVTSLAFAPDNMTLASGSLDKIIRVWSVSDAQTKEPKWSWNTDSEVLALAFSPDGKRLASGGGNGSLILWDIK